MFNCLVKAQKAFWSPGSKDQGGNGPGPLILGTKMLSVPFGPQDQRAREGMGFISVNSAYAELRR